jgi:hypothetical protein
MATTHSAIVKMWSLELVYCGTEAGGGQLS